MPGPTAKEPSIRARRNKTTTRAVLSKVENPQIPPLPEHVEWYQPVIDWWDKTWSSEMTPEWARSDVNGVLIAAYLYQQFLDPETKASVRVSTAAEIRQICTQYGLTPMSRRSLQWEIERGEGAAQQTAARRAGGARGAKTAKASGSGRPDPRSRRLKAVQ